MGLRVYFVAQMISSRDTCLRENILIIFYAKLSDSLAWESWLQKVILIRIFYLVINYRVNYEHPLQISIITEKIFLDWIIIREGFS